VLYEAMQPDFADSREIARGYDTEHAALAPRDGIYFYRVYAGAAGEQSAGSNIVVVRVRQDEWVQQDTSAYGDTFEQECLAVHRAALRLAAAGGDLLTVLALPRHFRTQDAVRYTQRLRSVNEPFAARDAAAFDFTEARALSYGALYFPWLQSDGRGTIVPPDGAAAGVLAARASRRGAWVAPANEPLVDVVALTPPIPPADWQQLQATQLNILRNEPRGFLTLSADTLALEPELRLINVRRLLILLRRLALRRGHSYVFEPLGPTLRRAVQRGFELLLTDMFRRGAFAGASVAQSFRVVTDNTVNMPRDAAAGRFVVELRVAPAHALHYLTVRLIDGGPGRLAVQEIV
jgi:phage tail sheath protein FI